MLSHDEFDGTKAGTVREEFNSHGGSVIDLGHFKKKTFRSTPYKEDFLVSTVNVKQNNLTQGLDQTRFHKGFVRRQKSNIHNAFTEEQRQREAEYAAVREKKRQDANQYRQQQIVQQDAKNGFNIINGQPKMAGPPLPKPQGLKTSGLSTIDGLGPEAVGRGSSVLRESPVGRFFAPHGSGPNHEHRQGVLYREGLLQDKGCGVIAVGKKEMQSYGIEDCFSKSEYMANSERARAGLYETRLPGKYTPRKIPGNPSGNPQIVQNWNTKPDLNGRTLQNRP